MTKQEEIREGIKDAITFCPENKECPHYGSKNWQDCIDCMVENVVTTLHSQGVGIKVEGEMPVISYHLANRGGMMEFCEMPTFGMWGNKPQTEFEAMEELEKIEALDEIRYYGSDTSYQCIDARIKEG